MCVWGGVIGCSKPLLVPTNVVSRWARSVNLRRGLDPRVPSRVGIGGLMLRWGSLWSLRDAVHSLCAVGISGREDKTRS